MPLDFRSRAWTQIQTGLLTRNLLIRLSKQMLESHGKELVLADVDVILLAHVALLDFILEDTTAKTTTPDSLEVVFVDGLLFLGCDTIGLAFDFFLFSQRHVDEE